MEFNIGNKKFLKIRLIYKRNVSADVEYYLENSEFSEIYSIASKRRRNLGHFRC